MSNWTNKDLGPIDAYALAVAGGYTGTKQQWINEIANASTNAQTASTKATAAAGSAEDAEAYGAGTRGGASVGSSDPAYHNNSKYYMEQAAIQKQAAQDAAATASAAYNVNLLAVNFDATKDHRKGQLVIYSGGLYFLPEGHTAGTTWENTAKDAVDMSNQVTDLRNAMADQVEITDLHFSDNKTVFMNLFGKRADMNTWVNNSSTNGNTYIIPYANSITPVTRGDIVNVVITNLQFDGVAESMFNWANAKIKLLEINSSNSSVSSIEYSPVSSHCWRITHEVNNINATHIALQLIIPVATAFPAGQFVYINASRILVYKGKPTIDAEINEVVLARGEYSSLKARLDGMEEGIDEEIDETYDTLSERINGLYDAISELAAGSGGGATDEDVYLLTEEIPPQYVEIDDDPSDFQNDSYLEKTIRNVPNGPKFLFFTDTHWASNEKHTIPIINYVKKRMGIANVLFGGDILNLSASGPIAKADVMEFMYQAKRAFGRTLLPTIGNHETNESNINGSGHTDTERSEHLLPFSELQPLFTGDIIHKIHTQYEDVKDELPNWATGDQLEELKAYFKTIYYYDDNGNKIRYICLNTGNPGNLTSGGLGVISDIFHVGWLGELRLQYEWFSDVLSRTPDNYKVVVFGHQLGTEAAAPSVDVCVKPIFQMASAVMMKTTVTVTPQQVSDNYPIKNWYSNANHTYDYTNAPDIESIIFVCGHSHFDAITVVGFDENDDYDDWSYDGETLYQREKGHIPMILTTTDAYGRYADAPEAVQVPMELGTTTDHAFDVFVYEEDGVAIRRFGAGNNRKVYIDNSEEE